MRRWRLAFAGFAGNSAGRIEKSLLEALAQNAGVTLIDASQVTLSLKGLGYNGSVNLTREEGRGIGAAIGCDFFILGKADAAIRSTAANESHAEALLGVMIVDGRSGALAYFDFILEKAPAAEAAESKVARTLASRLPLYLEKMTAYRAAHESFVPSSNEIVEEIPGPDTPRAAGFRAPEFINRVKPDYTEEAERADINATVEALVVFKASGAVGDIEIVRFAGFGLDEAAIGAIRQLQFKPATRDGKAINVRALIRYNFRRLNEK